jgi:hypothetical protein
MATDKERADNPPPMSDLFEDALAAAETPEDTAAAWHAYFEGGGEAELAEEVQELRIVLNEGQPKDAIEVANRGVRSQVRAIMQHQRDQSNPWQPRQEQ